MALSSEIQEYDPIGPIRFDEEKAEIFRRLGDHVEEIHHIGSTSIPGIAAKPEIDLLVIASSLDQIAAINLGMNTTGYDIRGECGIPGRHYFSKTVGNRRTHKVHLCLRSHRNALEQIVFRDYLRDHPDAARTYESLKVGLFKTNRTGIREYVDGKASFVLGIVERAITEGYQFQC
jgi:GrpB-like predicted nucleotidyltransferase (UPF0157 family)